MSHPTQDNTYTYDVLSVISENAKTKVYLASSPISEEPIVVKVLKDGDIQLVKKIAEISSPHLPRILHVGEGIVFEEYISGMPLDEYIKAESLSEQEIVGLILQICDGLRLLHTQEPPIIHRDLKPSNILVKTTDGKPEVKVIDFDASREYKPDQTHDTRALGTDTYAPPEQFGYSQTDVRSDIYSLGSVLDEVTKELTISEGLRAVIAKATMFNPDHRYANIDALAEALKTYGKKTFRLLPLLVVIAMVAIVTVCTVLIWKTSDKPEPEATTAAGEEKEVPTQKLDTINPETGSSTSWVFYYLPETPELSPLALRTMNEHGPAKDIRIGTDGDPYGKAVPASSWHEDEDGFVIIDDAYLSTLDRNVTYTVTVDFTDIRLIFNLMSIDDPKMAKISAPVLNPGYTEFVQTDPKDLTFHVENTFGRRLDSLINMDSGEKLKSDDYSYDEKSGTIVLSQTYFDKFKDGDYVNIEYRFVETGQSLLPAYVNKEYPTAVTVCVREKPYIVPVLKQKGVVVREGENEDIFVEIEFNSAKGKLEDVFLSERAEEEGKPSTLKPEDYEVKEDGILVRGTYLGTLAEGEYNLIFEFGDVARKVQLTVA